ncbi:MAG TPA: LysM domain-containing protein, partial [Kiritimatiellia bacterium]|nr:LysM domain-containing protein [Kiritimatiellia bacterium]
MKFIPDWKWKTALAALVLVTAAVVFWPLPDPPPPPESSLPAEEPVSTDDMLQYTVQEGDTPEAIARLFVIRLDDLMAANSMPLS